MTEANTPAGTSPLGLPVGEQDLPRSMYARAGDHGSVIQTGGDYTQNIGNPLNEVSVEAERADVDSCYAQISDHTWNELTRRWDEGSPLLVISGSPRVGKRATALKLLSRKPQGTQEPARVRELSPDWERRPTTKVFPSQPGTWYLLDLGGATEPLPETFGRELADFAKTQASRGTRLVITTTTVGWQRCAPSLMSATVPVEPPSARKVVVTHLERRLAYPERVSWLDGAPLDALVTPQMLPHDAVRLAEAIANAAAPGDHDPDTDPLADGVDEFRSWRGHLKDFFGDPNKSAEDRALLVAAAVLDGAEPLAVWQAAMRLLGADPGTESVENLLLGDDLEARLESITQAPVEDGVSLDAARHRLAEAVLPHVWRQRPPLREKLMAWIGELTTSGGMASSRLAHVGKLLSEVAARHPDFDLLGTVSKWAAGSGDNRSVVANLLTALAADAVFGSTVREKLLTWSYGYGQGTTTSTHFAEVVAAVCGGEFADRYPNQALVRIKWLLNAGERSGVQDVAARALRRMASVGDRARTVLASVLAWQEDAGLAAARGFLALMDPTADVGTARWLLEQAGSEPTVLADLGQGWEIAAKQEADHEGQQVLARWFTALATEDLPEEPTQTLLSRLWKDAFAAQRFGGAFIPEYNPPEEQAVRLAVAKRAFNMTATPDEQPQWHAQPSDAPTHPDNSVLPGTA